MNFLWLFVGGFILSYWVSRPPVILGLARSTRAITVVHIATFCLLAFATGFIRRAMGYFDLASLPIFAISSVVWARYDLARRRLV